MEKEKIIQEIRSVIESVDVDSLEGELISLIERTFNKLENDVLQDLSTMRISLERKRNKVIEETRKYIGRVYSIYASRIQLDFNLRNDSDFRMHIAQCVNPNVPVPMTLFYENMYRIQPIRFGYHSLQMTELQQTLYMGIYSFCGIKEHLLYLDELINVILWIEDNDMPNMENI